VQRRQLLKNMVSAGTGAMLLNTPLNLLANTKPAPMQVVNYKSLFNRALNQDPNLIGFANIADDFAPQELNIEGTIPSDLNGVFYRNGPAKHERNEQRYQHLFEGDGMLQRFNINNGKISHFGKFINTPKYQKEQQAQGFIYSGPDTKIADALPVYSADTINTANTNILPVGDDLWALWEGGSATAVDPISLEYKQQIDLGKNSKYENSLKGLPFSAHPKVSPDGDIWNFGLNPSGHVVLYHLSAKGQTKNIALINAEYRGGMLHDFLITNKHLLLILPSLGRKAQNGYQAQGFFSGTNYNAQQAMRVLVISKADLTVAKQYELPAGFAFHYGNAWEEPDGTIRFDASLYSNIDVLHNLSNVMKGQQSNTLIDAQTALFTLYANGTSSQTSVKGNSEFPRVCKHLVGHKNSMLYHLSSKHNNIWNDTVSSLNIDSGKQDFYYFGSDYLVEEHIPVCPQNREGTGYLIGTALHVPSKRTCLNVFNASAIADGPIARAWLSHHLPLGFHGNFKAA
jgi:all-trans-8'-apo-beta-carotenal 15,15'-oxygenase